MADPIIVLLTDAGVGPGGRPTYRLVKGGVKDITVGAMVVCTYEDLEKDSMVPLTKGG